jgi:hypothetical protein
LSNLHHIIKLNLTEHNNGRETSNHSAVKLATSENNVKFQTESTSSLAKSSTAVFIFAGNVLKFQTESTPPEPLKQSIHHNPSIAGTTSSETLFCFCS